MQFNKHAVLLPGWEYWEMPFTHFFPQNNAFPTILLMLLCSFNTNYDGITVLKQSAYRAIILAKILSYAPCEGFPTSIRNVPLSFFNDYTPMPVRQCLGRPI